MDVAEKDKHLKNSKTLATIIGGTPSKLDKMKPADIALLEYAIETWGQENGEDSTAARNEEIRKNVLIRELKRANVHLRRPLCNLDITVCNILNSKGLGADIVFLVGFDQGKFPSKKDPTDSEVYQMLVAITRAKKRLYLINTIDKKISSFVDCLDSADCDGEEIETKQKA